jgi:O-antigen ligase
MTTSYAVHPRAEWEARSAYLASLAVGLLMLLVFLGPRLALMPLQSTGDGNPVRQILYLGGLGLTMWAARVHVEPQRLLVVPISLAVALGWCALSLTWSGEPGTGLRRLILTLTLVLSVFLAIRTAGFDRSVKIIQITFLICLGLNFAAVAVLPTGVHHAVEIGDPALIGNWRGILVHKNFAGSVTAMTIIFLALGPQFLKPALRYAALGAAAFFLYMTHSKTSGAFAIGCVAIGFLFNGYNPRFRALVIPVLLIFTCLTVLVLQDHLSDLLAPFNRPDALTGRVQIWPVLINYASAHPWTGAGYGSFWNSGPDGPVFDYARSWVTGLGNGHNGYLDLLVQVGFPGLALAVFATMILPMAKLFSSQSIQPGRGGLLLAMLLFCIGHNITETSLFERDAIVQVFLMMAVALIEAATRDEAAPRQHGRVFAPDEGALSGAVQPDPSRA